ncbi:pyridoxamine 5'-phosphate oxidase family protein [Jeotgalibacillus soli]|uniref:Pyridoxamine 5'-phosphate oxidase N-terminal domain-containing protein n=1 Tax=Jeotgalibacillus soli TaxID=889306 RepID=A0A0C2R3B1_9BACL|nr:pyridoxamine 5'-phosphate oxidase family protein [Jeotgalibacillus soli]KIL44750.1 hypothetical protein KP78_22940 [Jeotgalibacillus soli]
MENLVNDRLTPAFYEELLHEQFVLLSTIDFETGGSNVSAISWVHSKDEKIILLAVDYRSRIIKNIKKQPLATLTIITHEMTFSISGTAKARVTAQSTGDEPIKLSIIELSINEVCDVMFYGSKIIAEPQYNKTHDQNAAEKLDNLVMQELKKYE